MDKKKEKAELPNDFVAFSLHWKMFQPYFPIQVAEEKGRDWENVESLTHCRRSGSTLSEEPEKI